MLKVELVTIVTPSIITVGADGFRWRINHDQRQVSDKGDFPFNLNERTDVSPANGDYLSF